MRLDYFAFGFATNDQYCSGLERCCCCSQHFAVSGNPRGCSRGSVVNVSRSLRVQTVNFSLRSFPRRQCRADLLPVQHTLNLRRVFLRIQVTAVSGLRKVYFHICWLTPGPGAQVVCALARSSFTSVAQRRQRPLFDSVFS